MKNHQLLILIFAFVAMTINRNSQIRSMQKTILFLLGFILISTSSIGQQDVTNPLSIGGSIFITNSKLETERESYIKEKAHLLGVGAFFNYPIRDYLQLHISVDYFSRGLNASSPFFKYRVNYITPSINLRYWFFDFFFLESGYNYSKLIKQNIITLDGHELNGYIRTNTIDYTSSSEIIFGGGIKLTDNINLGTNYYYSITDQQYNSLQFYVNYRIPKIQIDSKGKYHSLEEALANPLDCKILYLKSDWIQYLSPEIIQLQNLEELYLDWNELTFLPPELFELENLKLLSLKRNQIDSIPADIGKLKKLEFLYLGYNNLTSLPDEIGELKNLKLLNIGKNYLTELPASIGNLTNLIELRAVNSGILLQIPSSISNLSHLENIYLDETALLPIPYIPPNPRTKVIRSADNIGD